MHIRTFLKPLSFLPAILLMYMIFSFSAQEGDVSSSVSYKASCVLVKTADHVFDMGLDDYQISYFATKINGVTRKLAHMTEYFLLAIAVSFPLYVYGLRGILLMLLAGGFCVAFACGDEYHQSFVAGRSPSSKDVLIDSFGIFIGILIVRIVGWTGRMTLFRPIKEKQPDIPDQPFPRMSRKEQKRWKKQQKAMKKAGVPLSGSEFYSQGTGPYPYPGPYPQEPGSYPYGGSYPQDPGSYPYNGPYPQGPGSYPYNGPYPQESGSYPYNGPYPQGPESYPYGEPYPQGPGGYPYEPQPPQYMGRQEDHSSDELSDDMPLSHLLKPKNK